MRSAWVCIILPLSLDFQPPSPKHFASGLETVWSCNAPFHYWTNKCKIHVNGACKQLWGSVLDFYKYGCVGSWLTQLSSQVSSRTPDDSVKCLPMWEPRTQSKMQSDFSSEVREGSHMAAALLEPSYRSHWILPASWGWVLKPDFTGDDTEAQNVK